MSDARTVMAYLHWCHYIGYQVVAGKMVADRPFDTSSCHPEEFYEMADADIAALAEAGLVIVPREPTEKMHDAARDWSLKKYGAGIGIEASLGCWRAMVEAVNEQ